MEYRISRSLITTSSLNPLVLCLHDHLIKASLHSQCLPTRLIAHRLSCIYRDGFHRSNFAAIPSSTRTPCSIVFPSIVHRLQCFGNTASPFASTGGDGGFGGESGGGGGGGGDRSDGGDGKSKSAAAGAEDASAVIILDVGVSTTNSLSLSQTYSRML